MYKSPKGSLQYLKSSTLLKLIMCSEILFKCSQKHADRALNGLIAFAKRSSFSCNALACITTLVSAKTTNSTRLHKHVKIVIVVVVDSKIQKKHTHKRNKKVHVLHTKFSILKQHSAHGHKQNKIKPKISNRKNVLIVVFFSLKI